MAEAQQVQLHVMEAKGANSTGAISQTTESRPWNHMLWWLRIALYTIFVLCGQTSATLLIRLYYEKGGSSQWMGTLVQIVGFPVLLPYYYCISQPKVTTPDSDNTKPPSLLMLVFVYVSIGLLAAGNSFLYSVGFRYLPVSTVTLISASQLAFSAIFSYILNSQKFTPFVINSLVLITISSILLVANGNSEKPAGVSNGEYAAGFICTIFGAATYSFLLALQQLTFRKVLKRQTFRVVMDLIIYQSLVASVASLIGFFATGDWKGLKREMEGYELGKISYVMILLWTAIAWQIFAVGCVALIFKVSALFCNVIGALGLPITPIMAMFVFHDKMNGIKGISMVLAIWGFISYLYQHYLDSCKMNAENKNGSTEVSEA